MKKLLAVTSVCLFLMFASGCATIATGKYQNIPVTSDPLGVKVRADSGEMIYTPGRFNLIRNQNHTLVAEYEGAEPQQVQLKKKVQGWFWGNIILGGVIGGVVDIASGASDELVPKTIHFNFTSKGQQAAHRRYTYIRSNHLDEKIVFAIEHGATVKGMKKADLIASLGNPQNVIIIDDNDYDLVYNKPSPKKYCFRNGKLEKVEDV